MRTDRADPGEVQNLHCVRVRLSVRPSLAAPKPKCVNHLPLLPPRRSRICCGDSEIFGIMGHAIWEGKEGVASRPPALLRNFKISYSDFGKVGRLQNSEKLLSN